MYIYIYLQYQYHIISFSICQYLTTHHWIQTATLNEWFGPWIPWIPWIPWMPPKTRCLEAAVFDLRLGATSHSDTGEVAALQDSSGDDFYGAFDVQVAQLRRAWCARNSEWILNENDCECYDYDALETSWDYDQNTFQNLRQEWQELWVWGLSGLPEECAKLWDWGLARIVRPQLHR